MKIRFIYNPKSGRSKDRESILPLLRGYITAGRLDADIVCTEGHGHATQIARDALREGFPRIVVVGGDGTVNEVARALIGSPAAMGLVPSGSGNGLARHLKLPRTTTGAIEVAAGGAGRVTEIDTGTANGLTFVNAMGLGLDADVAHRFNRLAKRGLPTYVRTALAAFFGRKTETCVISCGSRRDTLETLLIAVANSDQYGNNARIAPNARVDDGVLNLVAVRPIGLLSALPLAARLFMGTFDRSPRVIMMNGSRFIIERPAAGIIHTDGDTHMAGACIEVVIHPRSLRLVVPVEA